MSISLPSPGSTPSLDPTVRTTPQAAATTAPGQVRPPHPCTGPADALADLLAGNQRFVEGRPRYGHDVSAAAATSGGQAPHAVVIGCIDSRVPLEAVFDQTFGCICVVRSAGHVLDRSGVGSVEFAVSVLEVPLVMVLGHERCGAIASTVEALREGRMPGGDLGYLVEAIAPAVREVGVDHPDVHTLALRRHVARTVADLAESPVLTEAVDAGRVVVVGAVYDLDSARVDLLD